MLHTWLVTGLLANTVCLPCSHYFWRLKTDLVSTVTDERIRRKSHFSSSSQSSVKAKSWYKCRIGFRYVNILTISKIRRRGFLDSNLEYFVLRN